MSNLALYAILQQYKTQRKYREAKRNQYLRRFEVLRQSFHPHRHQSQPADRLSQNQSHRHNHEHHHSHTQVHQIRQIPSQIRHHQVPILVVAQQRIPINSIHQHHHAGEHHLGRQQVHQALKLQEQENLLLEENVQLKKNLMEIQQQEKSKLNHFKGEIQNVRNKYVHEIQKLVETAKKSKEDIQSKSIKIQQQSETATKKNLQIQQNNIEVRNQLNQGNALMGKYATEIKKEYATKIIQFESIFNSSNEKIEAMEKDFNEDEFIENTLKNQELLKTIEENAEKAQEAGKILDDYGILLEGKKEILSQINNNNLMKEKEIEKMIELEGKMKSITDRLTTEKKRIVTENTKMAEELLQIKELLMGAMAEQK